jgi:polyhydroxyalkanoate synthesis regulator phasin
MEQLKELLTSSAWAAKRAQIAIKLTEDLKSGELSADEYKELINDLKNTDQLNLQAEELEIKVKLESAINTLLKLI